MRAGRASPTPGQTPPVSNCPTGSSRCAGRRSPYAFGAVPVRLDPGATARAMRRQWSKALACREGLSVGRHSDQGKPQRGASGPKGEVRGEAVGISLHLA